MIEDTTEESEADDNGVHHEKDNVTTKTHYTPQDDTILTNTDVNDIDQGSVILNKQQMELNGTPPEQSASHHVKKMANLLSIGFRKVLFPNYVSISNPTLFLNFHHVYHSFL